MKFLFFLQGVIGIVIFLFLLFKMTNEKNKKNMKVMKNFFFLGVLNLIVSFLSFFWFFDFLDYIVSDYMIFFCIFLLLQNLIFFRITYIFSRNRKLYYFVGMYLFAVPFLIFVLHISGILFLIMSYLFSLLIFVDFAMRDDLYRKVGYLGILYSAIGILMSSLLFFNIKNVFLFNIVLEIFLFILIYYFVFDVDKFSILPFSFSKNNSYFFNLMSHLIFIITIANFVFIGTIGVHEFGHYAVGEACGCEYSKIIYDASSFHTESLCADESIVPYVTLGGVLLPVLIAIVLFIFGGRFMSEIAMLIAGFDLASASKDLATLGLSQNFILGIVLSGGFLVIYGIFMLAKSKIDLEIYENFPLEDFSGDKNKEVLKKSSK